MNRAMTKSLVLAEPSEEFQDVRGKPAMLAEALSQDANWANFSRAELETFLLIVDGSLKVHNRAQFFMWTQGVLQSVLPHSLLVCALNDASSGAFTTDCFYTQPLPEGFVHQVCRPDSGAAYQMMRIWREHGCAARTIRASGERGGEFARIGGEFEKHGISNFVLHGTRLSNGQTQSFFGFGGVPEQANLKQSYLLEIFLPHMHTAWIRTHIGDRSTGQAASPAMPHHLLTLRELEVLNWVHCGKSNAEIGIILSISALTVKNHVQKILRKLDVQNRTQAVSKGMALRLFDLQAGGQ
jgi:transcriptional regulator EpsA